MKKTNPSAARWTAARLKKFIPAIIAISAINAITALIGIYMAFLSKRVLDMNATGTLNRAVLFGGMLFAAVVVSILLSGISSAINVRVGGKITISLRRYLFSVLVRRHYSETSKYHSGELLNRFTSDIDVISSLATSTLPSVVSMITKVIAGVIALTVLNSVLSLIVVLTGTLFPFFGRFISRKYKYLHKQVQQTEGLSRSFLQESFANLVVIKSFRSEQPILNKLDEYMQQNLKIKIKRNFISVIISVLMQSFFSLGYYGVLIWGALQFSNGLTYGTLNAYLQLISQLRTPLQNLSGILPQYYSAMASAERLMELEQMDTEPEPLSKNELDKLRGSFENLVIDNVAFAYDDELILQNCSFTVPKNKITAITGESGCGKSTLFKLILGLYEPSGGKITVNGDIPVGPATRGLFAYVPQGNMILSGTVRENITMCNPDIDGSAVENAARAADIYDYISSLPEGFETRLSERGGGLSEGQVQRISIARALLSDAPILLLDEATSALDEATETAVLSNISKMTDKTVLFITHRNTSISVCDHIVHANGKKFTVVK